MGGEGSDILSEGCAALSAQFQHFMLSQTLENSAGFIEERMKGCGMKGLGKARQISAVYAN